MKIVLVSECCFPQHSSYPDPGSFLLDSCVLPPTFLNMSRVGGCLLVLNINNN